MAAALDVSLFDVIAEPNRRRILDLLREHAVEVQPFDVSQTASALDAALTMDGDERAARAIGLRTAALAHPADRWLDDLVSRARPARTAD